MNAKLPFKCTLVIVLLFSTMAAKPAGFGEQKNSSQPSGFGEATISNVSKTSEGATKITFVNDNAAQAAAKRLIEENGGKDGEIPRYKLRKLIDPKLFKSKLIDPNNDAKVSEAELAAVLKSGIPVASAEKVPPLKTPAKSKEPATTAKPASGQKKSYRFLPAKERLPKEIPGWFTSKDRDGDGQVAMAEYSSRWSDRDAEAFARYDANGDGFITPEEAK